MQLKGISKFSHTILNAHNSYTIAYIQHSFSDIDIIQGTFQ